MTKQVATIKPMSWAETTKDMTAEEQRVYGAAISAAFSEIAHKVSDSEESPLRFAEDDEQK